MLFGLVNGFHQLGAKMREKIALFEKMSSNFRDYPILIGIFASVPASVLQSDFEIQTTLLDNFFTTISVLIEIFNKRVNL